MSEPTRDDPWSREAGDFADFIAAFEADWEEHRRQGAPRPCWHQRLPESGALRFRVAVELAIIDLERRLACGETARVEEYVQQLPDLGADAAILTHLARTEFEGRQRMEPDVRWEDFQPRFPQLFPADLAVQTTNPLAPQPSGTNAHEAKHVPTIPGYEVGKELGRGAMGVVYQARHIGLNRVVALKVIRSGSFATVEQRARFHTEAEAVAQLQHPNIVQIYEIGEDNGHPFFSMEYVAGGSLEQKLAGKPLPPEEAARLIETLASAVHCAHEHGIIHRDLKPANILLTADGQPKISDFGLAKKLGDAGHTLAGDIIGTPRYMAPEQAASDIQEIGPATDVYALGVILYEMITGGPPFRGVTVVDTLDQLRVAEPIPPTRAQPKCPRDLETICLKCLQKGVGQRYPSALSLAADLRRFLENKPIEARPAGPLERAWKWCRREPALATIMVLAVLLSATVVAFLTNQVWNEQQKVAMVGEKLRVETEARRQEHRQLAEAAFAAAFRRCEERDVAAGLKQFADSLELACRAEATALERAVRLNLAAWSEELHSTVAKAKLVPPGVVPSGRLKCAALAPLALDRVKIVATYAQSSNAHVWTWQKGQLQHEWTLPVDSDRPGRQIVAIALSPDGNCCFTATATEAGGDEGTGFLWRLSARIQPEPIALTKGAVIRSAAFSPDGAWLVTGSKTGTVQVWDVATGTAVGQPLTLPHAVTAVAIDDDKKMVLAGMEAGETVAWEIGSRQRKSSLATDPAHQVTAVAMAPGSKFAITGTAGMRAYVWDPATGRTSLFGPLNHRYRVSCIAIHRQGDTLLTGDLHKAMRLWNADTGEQLGAIMWHRHDLLAVGFVGASQLISVDAAGIVYGWEIASRNLKATLPCQAPVWSVKFSADAKRLLVATGADGGRGQALLWDLDPSPKDLARFKHSKEVYSVAFHPTEPGRILAGNHDGFISIWPFPSDATPPKEIAIGSRLRCFAVSPDGKWILAGTGDYGKNRRGSACLIDARSGEKMASTADADQIISAVAFHQRDGRTQALVVEPVNRARPAGTIRVFDVIGGTLKETFTIHPTAIAREAVFSSDGSRVLFGSVDGHIYWQEMAPNRPLHALKVCEPGFDVNAVAWHPRDERLVLVGSNNKAGQLWDLDAGQPIGPALRHQHTVDAVTFSLDGAYLATGSQDSMVRIWITPELNTANASIWQQHPERVRAEIHRRTNVP